MHSTEAKEISYLFLNSAETPGQNYVFQLKKSIDRKISFQKPHGAQLENDDKLLRIQLIS